MSEALQDNLTFEQSLLELERIVRELEDGRTNLEQSLANYENGVGLLKHCYGHLRKAEQRIMLLSGVDEDGKPRAQLFDHTASADAKPKSVRGRKSEN